MKKNTNIIIFIIVIAMIFPYLISYADRNEDLKNVNEELKKIQNDISQQKEKISDLSKTILGFDIKIQVLEDEIQSINFRLQDAKDKIDNNRKKIRQKEEEIKVLNKALKDRVRIMSKTNSLDYIKIIFSSKNIEDFLTNYTIIKRIVEQDKKNMDTLSNAKKELSEIEEGLKDLQDSLNYIKQDYDRQTQALEQARQYQNENLAKLEQDLNSLLEIENLKVQEAAQITAELRQLAMGGLYQGNYTGGALLYPVPGGAITSPYGYRQHPILNERLMHTGIDIAGNMGQSILSSEEGRVIFSGTKGTYGKTVMVDHGSGIVTLYAHCSQLYVSEGDIVVKGQTIAAIGSTGRSTGPHLHYEVRVNGEHTDPINYLR